MSFFINIFIIFLVIAVIIKYFKYMFNLMRYGLGALWKVAMVFGGLIVFAYMLRSCGM